MACAEWVLTEIAHKRNRVYHTIGILTFLVIGHRSIVLSSASVRLHLSKNFQIDSGFSDECDKWKTCCSIIFMRFVLTFSVQIFSIPLVDAYRRNAIVAGFSIAAHSWWPSSFFNSACFRIGPLSLAPFGIVLIHAVRILQHIAAHAILIRQLSVLRILLFKRKKKKTTTTTNKIKLNEKCFVFGSHAIL